MSDQGGSRLYHYEPSLPAAIVFTLLFAAAAGYHWFKLVRTRTWYFIVFGVGCVFEVIGYIGRIIGSQEVPDYSLGAYIIQTLFILLAPPLFAASIYMTLGRLAEEANTETLLPIRRKFLTPLFVTGDVISFLMQCSGGGLMASADPDTQKMGENIAVAGLCIQLVFFGGFVISAIIYHVRSRKTSLAATQTSAFRNQLLVLYAASILIFIRSVFRTIEFAQGFDGYLISHEVYLYIFDAVLMTGVVVLYILVHPSEMARLRTIDNLPLYGHQGSPQQLSDVSVKA